MADTRFHSCEVSSKLVYIPGGSCYVRSSIRTASASGVVLGAFTKVYTTALKHMTEFVKVKPAQYHFVIDE
jgi:hypothetical protein